MLPGDIQPGVLEWHTEVLVGGVARDVTSVSFSSELAGGLPDQVIASGGVGGASGTIRWAPQQVVRDRPVHPWDKVAGWPPSSGDPVVVRVTDGTTTWTRFTGVIDKTTGDTTGYQSSIIDFRDKIAGTVTHEALLRHMPPYTEGGAYRSIGLNHWHLLTAALRAAGLYNVPRTEAPSAVSIPCQGSVWAEAGDVMTASGTGSNVGPSFYYTSFGYAAAAFTATYRPRLTYSSTVNLQMTIVVPGIHAGVATVDVVYGASAVRLRVNESRGVTAFYSPTGTAPWTSVASVGGASASVDTVVQLLVKGSAWTLRTSNGATGTGTQTRAAGSMSTVAVDADAASRVAGIQVSHPDTTAREFQSLGFTPSMRFQASGLASTMDMSPALRGRPVVDVVDEITEATLTAAWWDEQGVLRLVPSDQLLAPDPSQTIRTDLDITSLDWEDSLLGVRSAVDVEWANPAISKSREYRLELWRGPEESVVNGDDPVKQFVEPPSGQEWFGVDRTVRKLDDTNWGAFNDRRGSYSGLRYEYISGSRAGEEVPTTSSSVGVATENLYADSLIITTTVNSIPSNVEAISGTSNVATALRLPHRGKPLPVVRGMGRGEWVDATYTKTGGPLTAPRLTHRLGYWGGEFFEGGSVAQRIGDFLAGRLFAPLPTIPGLGVVFDPRRQVTDVLTLRSDWLGIELRLVVTGISEDYGDGYTQSLTVRVIRATLIRDVTYDELAAAWTDGNYNALQAAWTALTYDDMAADPLRGAPN